MTTTAIGTLRLSGAAADTPALRLRAARELAGADLAPPGLPPAAVLVVRRLADLLPRRLGGGGPQLRPDAAWERAVRERLAAAARTAARPDARGALPADPAAVLFADQAELLACAVRERVHGALATRWWWRAVRRRLPAAAAADLAGGRDPAPLLAACPREAPVVLARLVRWGEARAVAAALTPGGTARALATLASEHGLARELVGPPSRAGRGSGWRSSARENTAMGEAIAWEGAAVEAVPPEPWRPWLPAALADQPLPSEVRCLFGVCLGLAAAPHRLRAPDLARRGRRWWRALSADRSAALDRTRSSDAPRGGVPATDARAASETRGTGEPLDPSLLRRELAMDPQEDVAERRQPTPPSSLPSSSLTTASADTAGEDARFRVGREGQARERPAAAFSAAGETAAREEARRERRVRDETAAPATEEAELPPGAARERKAKTVAEPLGEAAAADAAAAEPAFAVCGDRVIETRLGGVLYLIHVLLDLGLPEAFERGWRLASMAGPWGTLDLLARGLLGGRSAGAARGDLLGIGDALWDALAELAAWPATARRSGSRPAYRVPAAWPAKLADPCDAFLWSAAAGRLRVWSAAGYLLADVRRHAEPPSCQARRELVRVVGPRAAAAHLVRAPAAAAPLARVLPPLPPGCPPLLGAWLAAVLPAVRRRLLLALAGRRGGARARALRAAPGGRRDPVARALAVPGSLHLTSSHLDLVLPLAAARLAVRRAGLDRDPGWLPGFGRVVSFHFE